jgi:hypothetical protein
MGMLQTRFWAAVAAALVSIGWAGLAAAASLNVPGDFATIKVCINATVSGVDECVVAPGTYHEKINLLGKAITVRSSSGRDVTTIDATGIGGSVVTCFSGEGPDTVLDGFTIAGGTGTYGGGMYNTQSSSPTVTQCTFSGNTGSFGGGMYNYDNCIPTVTNCTFSGNTACFHGGGMYNRGGNPTVTNCTFSANTADYGGGMYNHYNSSPSVTNCTFSGNTAYSGGGMCNRNSSGPTLTNCVLRGDIPDEIVNTNLSAPTMSFNDVHGGLPVGAIDGGGNIDLDPMFVRPPGPGPDGTWGGVDDDYGDLRLQAGSPCINAGDPGTVGQPGETDLEGHARVLCGPVDMGAYEFGIGDYDCDQVVDLADFSSWQACMTAPLHTDAFHSTIDPPLAEQSTIGCEVFAFDADGDVDLLDFAAFQSVLTAP